MPRYYFGKHLKKLIKRKVLRYIYIHTNDIIKICKIIKRWFFFNLFYYITTFEQLLYLLYSEVIWCGIFSLRDPKIRHYPSDFSITTIVNKVNLCLLRYFVNVLRCRHVAHRNVSNSILNVAKASFSFSIWELWKCL